jgi:pyridoxal phosphate enzyme (YggS family)
VPTQQATPERRDEIAAGLTAARERIVAAACACGRNPADIGLVVVTKTFPPSDVAALADLGVEHVGENRDQEAAPKAAELSDLSLVWHFVGQLQTNKARSVARYANVVESVDRVRLVSALNGAAAAEERHLTVLVQVSLESSPGRGGASPEEVAPIAEAVAAAKQLSLGGVMAVAPLDVDPDLAFGRLQQVAAELVLAHPEADTVSAGMSVDLEAAIRNGATQVRLGTAILGYRPPVG